MNIINSISTYPFPSLGENFLLNPNPQHARILKIMIFAFASLAACFGLIYCYLKAKNFNKDGGVQIKQIKIQPPADVEKEENIEKLAKSNRVHEELDQKNSVDKAEIPSAKEENVPTQEQSPFLPKNEKPTQEQSLNLAKNPHVDEKKEITEEQPPFIPSHTELKVDAIVPQQVPQSNTKSAFKLLPNEVLLHLFRFLELEQITKLSSDSKELGVPAKFYLSSFECQLHTFYQLSNRSKLINDPSKKIIEDKKRKECFELLLGFPNLKKHFENKDNRKTFFNHLQEVNDYDYKYLFQNELKIVQDLYFEFATDEKLVEFITIFTTIQKDDFLHALKFIDSLDASHLERLKKIVAKQELGFIEDLIDILNIRSNKPSPFLFDIINIMYCAKPRRPIWEDILKVNRPWRTLRPYVMVAYILRHFTTSNQPNFVVVGLNSLAGGSFGHLCWEECFAILVPQIEFIEENKRIALMEAIFYCNITACYEFIMLILKTKKSNLIFSFLKEYLALNHAQDKPEMGFACIFEYIKNKEQAIALIQAIRTLPPNLQALHFSELHNRFLLIHTPHPKKGYNYLFGRIEPEDLYQDWEAAFKAYGLELKDYPRLKGNAFNVGCQNHKLGK